jgi:hypothetical protein
MNPEQEEWEVKTPKSFVVYTPARSKNDLRIILQAMS